MSIEQLTEVLGWSLVINSAILIFTSIAIVGFRNLIMRTHQRFFDISDADLGRAYFHYLGQFKIAILVLNLAPYLSLKVMGF